MPARTGAKGSRQIHAAIAQTRTAATRATVLARVRRTAMPYWPADALASTASTEPVVIGW